MSLQASFRRQVYEAIELSNTQIPPATLKDYLSSNKSDLLSHLNYYDASTRTLPDNYESSMNATEAKFIEKCSIELSISKSLSLKLLKAFVREKVMNPVSSTDSSCIEFNDDLVQELKYFLFSEKEATLLLWYSMLRASDYQQHPFYQEITWFVQECFPSIDKAKPFLKSLLECFVSLSSKQVPASVLWSSEHATRHALHYLNLQKGILEVLFFMFYTLLKCPTVESLFITSKLSLSRFGLDQCNASLFDDECVEIMRQVNCLALILCLNVYNFEDKFNQIVNPISDTMRDTMTQTPDELLKFWQIAKALASSTNTIHIYSPLVLAIGILITKTSLDTDLSQFADRMPVDAGTRLVQKAFQSNVFAVLTETCKSELFGGKEIAKAYKSVLKGLLMLFIKLYPVNAFSRDEFLFEFASILFKDSFELSTQYWEQDFPIVECRDLLTTCRLRFPLVFKPFTNLVSSLINDETTAIYAFRYLKSCPGYCDSVDDSRYLTTMERNVFEFTGNLLLKSQGLNLNVPRHTQARLLASNVVFLEYSYSLWHLIFCLLDAFASGELVDLSDIEDSLDLLVRLIEHGHRTVFDKFTLHISEFIESDRMFGIFRSCLQRACESITTHHVLVCKIIKLYRLLYVYEPQIVMKELRHTLLAPPPTPLLISNTRFSNGSIALLEEIISFERSSGEFAMTLEYIQLITLVLDKLVMFSNGVGQGTSVSQDKGFSHVFASIKYILKEVWCNYGRWRSTDPISHTALTLSILGMLNLVIEKSNATLDDQEKWIVEQLMFSHDRAYLDPLLSIVSTGYVECKHLYSKQMFSLVFSKEAVVIAGLKLMKNLLAVKERISLHVQSHLEQRLLDYSESNHDVIQTLGLYIQYTFDRRIPLYATQCLTLFLRHSSLNSNVFSLLGYMSPYSTSLVQQYLTLALVVDEELQVAIFEFLAQVFESQPSLAMVFFGNSHSLAVESSLTVGSSLTVESASHEKTVNSTQKTASSSIQPALFTHHVSEAQDRLGIVDCVSQHLKQLENLSSNKPRLLNSVLQFLCSLWYKYRENKLYINKIKQLDEFWDALLKLIPCEIEFPSIDAQIDSSLDSDDTVDDVAMCCYLMSARCCAMRLFTIDVFNARQTNTSNTYSLFHDKGIKLVSASLKQGWFERDTTFSLDVNLFQSLKTKVESASNAKSLSEYSMHSVVSSGVYGKHFVYNICGTVEPISHILSSLNRLLSVADAQMVALQSWSFCLRAIDPTDSKELWQGGAIAFLEKLVDLSLNQSRQEYPFCKYQDEISALLLYFSFQLSKEKALEDTLLGQLSQLVSHPSYSIDDFSSPKHLNWISGLSYWLSRIDDSSLSLHSTNIVKIASTAIVHSSRVIQTLFYSAKIDFAMEAKRLLGCLLDLLQSCLLLLDKTPFNPVTLTFLVNKHDFASLLMRIFAHFCGSLSDQPDTILVHILDCLVACANTPSLAQILYKQGILTWFSSLELFPLLSEALVKPYTNSTVNGWHSCWCKLLLLLQRMYSTVSIEDCKVNIVSLAGQQYWKQISARMNVAQEPCLYHQTLYELEYISQLFFLFADRKVNVGSQAVNVSVHIGYQALACRLIKYLVVLLSHPKLLKSRLIPVTQAEKDASTLDSRGNSVFISDCTNQLQSVLSIVIHYLRVSSGADNWFNESLSQGMWNSVTFVSTLSPSTSLTVGDLIDLAAIFAKLPHYDGVVESVLMLLIYEYMHSKNTELRNELVQFGRVYPKIIDSFGQYKSIFSQI